jgi:hypothetical protein
VSVKWDAALLHYNAAWIRKRSWLCLPLPSCSRHSAKIQPPFRHLSELQSPLETWLFSFNSPTSNMYNGIGLTTPRGR